MHRSRSGLAPVDRLGAPATPANVVSEAPEVDWSELTEAVAQAAKGLRFGSIEVVVHDARIVQVVRTEKRRIVR
jgi:hypothetical protein